MRKIKIVEPLETPLRIARIRMNQAFIVDADNSIVIVCYAKYAELIVDAVNAYAESKNSFVVEKTETTSSEEAK